jgi:hypothetical protein
MKYFLLWITILGLVLGGAVWAAAQQQGQMSGAGGMMGSGGMMGGGGMRRESQSPQGTGEAVSNFSNLCLTCHGPGGKGNGPMAAGLNPKPRDFSDCKTMAKDSDDILFKAIKGGSQSIGRSAMMPPWGGALTDEQIHELVSYVRTFCKK